MANTDVRSAALASGVKLWQIAESLGVTDGTFSRWLRRELSDEKKQEIMRIIRDISGEVEPCAE